MKNHNNHHNFPELKLAQVFRPAIMQDEENRQIFSRSLNRLIASALDPWLDPFPLNTSVTPEQSIYYIYYSLPLGSKLAKLSVLCYAEVRWEGMLDV